MNRRSFIAAGGAAVIASNAVLGNSAEKNSADERFAAVKALLKGKEPINWVFTGDSITHGALHTFGRRSYVEHFAERVRWELRRMNDFVINTGISGDTMKGISADVERRIFQFRPQAVSVMIGTNDCRSGAGGLAYFRSSIEALIGKVRDSGAVLLLNTPNLISFPNDKQRSGLPMYVAAMRELAETHKVPLVDHYAYWEKEAVGSKLQMWLNDGSIHPNGFGHLALARKIFIDLEIFDEKSSVCRSFVP